jgi:hypothetical protein
MTLLLRLIDLVTSDALSLAAASVLALAIVGLLLVLCWPSSDRAPKPRGAAISSRSVTARSLAAAGTPALEIARQTGLSRDALALVLGGKATRQNSPLPARFSLFGRLRRSAGSSAAVA